VSVDPSSLGEGSYFGSVAIATPGGTGVLVPIQVNVALLGTLTTSPQSLTFSYQLGAAGPAAQTLNLATTSASAIAFTAGAASLQCGGNWLTVSPQIGSAPAALSVQINTSGLQAGTCAGTINFSAPSSATPMVSVPVTLTVTTAGLLQVATSGVDFTYQVGTGLPAAQTLEVTSSSAAVAFTVTPAPSVGGPAFLDVSPAGGTTPQAVTLALDTAVTEMLQPNTYSETVTISSPGLPNSAVTFPVMLVVSDNPVLLLSQAAVTFNYQIGQSDPSDQFLTIASSGAPLNFTVATATSNCTGFLSANPTIGSTSTDPGNPTQVDLTVDTTNMTMPETCNGTVTIAAPGSPTQIVPVVVNVSNTPLLDATPCVLDVATFTGPGMAVQQTISLASTDGVTPIDFAATAVTVPAGMTWLSLTPNSGTAPANLTVTLDPTNLTAGTYMGSINLTSTTAGVLPQSIPVVLTVSAGTVTVSAATLNFTMSAGGPNPANQIIQLANIPGGAALNAMATTDGSNFLTVTMSGDTIVASADGSQLDQGMYQGLVTVLVAGASNSPIYIPVTLTVGPPAVFTPAPAALSFNYQVGGALPPAQTIQLAGAGSGMVDFSAMAVAPPGSTTGIVFVNVTPASGTTPASLTVSVDQTVVPIMAPGIYTAFINLTSDSAVGTTQSIPVTLTISTPTPPAITSIVSGASFQTGAVSPGEVVTIFGTNIGPAVPADLTLNSSNMLETTLNNTTVTFNGVPAPLIFVSLNQINAIVPYEVAGQASIPLVITTGGIASAPLAVNVAATVPALFALGQSGSGPGAILNQNGTLNAAANPAAPGSTIVIYATGEGVTTPATLTGSVTPATGSSFPAPSATVSVSIGGIDARILYAGEAPGLIAGVLQVNAVVPAGTPAGNQPVVLTVGGVGSPSSVTAVIQ
jgi:uncharacterized protein (TIGR03437 family)